MNIKNRSANESPIEGARWWKLAHLTSPAAIQNADRQLKPVKGLYLLENGRP
jgi:hypothetical protein